MNMRCPHCSTPLNIPDHKIPRDKDSAFKCPKCREKVQVRVSQLNLSENSCLDQNTDKESLDSIDFSAQGRRQALVCMAETLGREKILAACSRQGFETETPASLALALKKMAYHVYPLVIVDEQFDQGGGVKHLAVYMNELDMSTRRRICLIWVSERLATGDLGAAFLASLNYVVGLDGLDHLDEILASALGDHANLYRVYTDSMRAAGKA